MFWMGELDCWLKGSGGGRYRMDPGRLLGDVQRMVCFVWISPFWPKGDSFGQKGSALVKGGEF